MTFEYALRQLKDGWAVRRRQWPFGHYITASPCGSGVIFYQGAPVLGRLSHTDIMADDWRIHYGAGSSACEGRASEQTQTVYQWRYRNSRGVWVVTSRLHTEEYVKDNWRWAGAEYEKHAGPFEVPC